MKKLPILLLMFLFLEVEGSDYKLELKIWDQLKPIYLTSGIDLHSNYLKIESYLLEQGLLKDRGADAYVDMLQAKRLSTYPAYIDSIRNNLVSFAMAFELYYLQELSKDSGGVQQSKIFQLKSKLNKEKLSLNDYQNLFKSDVSKVDLSNKVYQFFAQLIMINIIPFNATARVIESQAPSSSEVNADDILSITVDSADQLYCNGRPVNKEQLFSMAKTHLDKRRSSAVILILFSPKSNLDFYMSIFNGLKQINEDLRNQYSRTVYKKEFKELSATEQSDVKAQFPFSVTEVEKDE